MKKSNAKLVATLVAMVLAGAIVIAVATRTSDGPQPGLYSGADSATTVTASHSNKFATREVKLDIKDEEDFMEAIHFMTHQKVSAGTKWGALEITNERIDEMLSVLDKEDFSREDFYRETLLAWKEGDFSNAVDVHNRIWNIQDGTIGRANRMLTEEEESKYIEAKF